MLSLPAPMSEKGTEKKIFDFSLLRRVFRFAAPYKKKFYISLVLAILLAVLSPIRPWLIQLTINDYVPKGASATDVLEKAGFVRVVVTITLIQVGLLLVEVFFRF